jgi:predicted Zn-dependent protease
MNKIKYFTLLLLVPFLTAFYEPEQAMFGPASYPDIQSYWVTKPVVKVCKVLSISKSRVSKALNYWEKLGYEFEEVIYNDESMSCAGKPLFGEIIITIPDQNFDYEKIAITRRTVNRDLNMVMYAEIFLQEKETTKERVLEHEIGHAFGWDHTYRRYHLMNEMWERGGHDSTGVDSRRYRELSKELESPKE